VIEITFYTKFGPKHNKPDEPNLVSWFGLHATIRSMNPLGPPKKWSAHYSVKEDSKLSVQVLSSPNHRELEEYTQWLMCGMWQWVEGPDPDNDVPEVGSKPYEMKISEENGKFYVQHSLV
jgi:hypothetical protein